MSLELQRIQHEIRLTSRAEKAASSFIMLGFARFIAVYP